jgi:hypothetical protein
VITAATPLVSVPTAMHVVLLGHDTATMSPNGAGFENCTE